MEYTVGQMVYSKSGHDKGLPFIITETDVYKRQAVYLRKQQEKLYVLQHTSCLSNVRSFLVQSRKWKVISSEI